MSIEIISTKENKDDQTAFFKLTYDNEDYEFHGDCPKGVDPQEHFTATEDDLTFLILGKMYQDADWERFKTDKNTKLEAMQAWITDGHRNKVIIGETKAGKPKYGYEVIEKKPWQSTHPPHIEVLKKIDDAEIDDNIKELLKDIVKDKI